jgi:hypothetical protein
MWSGSPDPLHMKTSDARPCSDRQCGVQVTILWKGAFFDALHQEDAAKDREDYFCLC